MFDPLRLYEIDLTDTQLSDDELAEIMARMAEDAKLESAKDKARWAKARSFRFQGGML